MVHMCVEAPTSPALKPRVAGYGRSESGSTVGVGSGGGGCWWNDASLSSWIDTGCWRRPLKTLDLSSAGDEEEEPEALERVVSWDWPAW